MEEYQEEVYHSYNEFFTRRIRPEARPVAKNEKYLISPCDGKATVSRIGGDSRFLIKDTEYTVGQLLRN
ncbi:phosphatidylserine decarboxylase, partial [gut metagenome]